MSQNTEERAQLIAGAGSLQVALTQGTLGFAEMSAAEALVLGLLQQGVRKYIGIFGHGSTHLGEILRLYSQYQLVQVYNLHSEIEASHCAAALRWVYGETAVVFTSIGPGALQAMAASLVPLSSGLGLYYVFGDETTEDEGPNMQQIPKREQGLFLRLASTMSRAYQLHTPAALQSALKRGIATVFSPIHCAPFYFLLPINIQPQRFRYNLNELPTRPEFFPQRASAAALARARKLIAQYHKITIRLGHGASCLPGKLILEFAHNIGAVIVHSPNISGVVPYSHAQNMLVAGSKGSICGNYALEQAELIILVGSRGVCQSDSSGTIWKNTKQMININTSLDDSVQYNHALPLIGGCAAVIQDLNEAEYPPDPLREQKTADWLCATAQQKALWQQYKAQRLQVGPLYDQKQQRKLLTQVVAIDCVLRFAQAHQAIKFFDAGDIQANGFQLVEDEQPGATFTDTGASYMGFAASGMLASALAEPEKYRYPIAFSGEGSFMMNPQILHDAPEYRLRGMIVIFDNRRMSAISHLQQAQYQKDFATDDAVAVDYVQLANSFAGVRGFWGGYSKSELGAALEAAYQFAGLSVVHVPVYYGEEPLADMGAFGDWNVGNWCSRVQAQKHQIGL